MAILANQKILTLDYWKTAHDLKKGDIVFDRMGKPRTVTLVQEYRATSCFEITFNDYLKVSGDQNLSFLLEDTGYRVRLFKYKGVKKFEKQLILRTIEELMEPDEEYSLPTAGAIELPHQTLPVPPFLFGFWFFNRLKTRRLPVKMAPPPGLREVVHEKFREHGYKIREHDLLPKGERMFSVSPTLESHLIGVPTHRIPNNYLWASVEQRIELLRGILHAKSHQFIKEKQRFRFSTKYHAIAVQVQGLLESLGHRILPKHETSANYYTIWFRSQLPLMEGQTFKSKVMVHNGRRFIKGVKKLPAQLCVHIETDGPDNSILVGEGFISCL